MDKASYLEACLESHLPSLVMLVLYMLKVIKKKNQSATLVYKHLVNYILQFKENHVETHRYKLKNKQFPIFPYVWDKWRGGFKIDTEAVTREKYEQLLKTKQNFTEKPLY